MTDSAPGSLSPMFERERAIRRILYKRSATTGNPSPSVEASSDVDAGSSSCSYLALHSDGATSDMNYKLTVNQEADIGIRIMQRDQHEERIEKMRNVAKNLDKDDWMYPSIESILSGK